MKKRLSTDETYRQRVDTVTEYIRSHLDAQTDLTTLARISAFSPFHFHRVMRAFLGEPIGAYIVRVRVQTAAQMLRYTDMTVSEIAYRVGYDTPSSLTKSFVRLFGISPTAYRTTKNYQVMTAQSSKPEILLSRPRIVDIAPKTVLYINVSGNYKAIDYSTLFTRLWDEVKRQKLFTAGIEHLALYYDNPEVSQQELLQCSVCLRVCKPAEPNGEIGVKEIHGGRFVVATYTGPYDAIGGAYDRIYGEWLPQNGCRTRDGFCIEKYVSDPRRVAPEKRKTEIYIPVE